MWANILFSIVTSIFQSTNYRHIFFFPSIKLLWQIYNTVHSEKHYKLSEVSQQFKHVVIGQLVTVLSVQSWETSTFVKRPWSIFEQWPAREKSRVGNISLVLHTPTSLFVWAKVLECWCFIWQKEHLLYSLRLQLITIILSILFNFLFRKMSEMSKTCPSQFAIAQGDVFNCLFCPTNTSKSPNIQLTFYIWEGRTSQSLCSLAWYLTFHLNN